MEALIGAVPFQVARTSAVLPAAGAYDTSPTELMCAGFESAVFYFSYTRGDALGSFAFKIEVSPHASDSATYDNWFQLALYEADSIVAGTDEQALIQREEILYTPTSANEERFVYGSVNLGGGIQRVRVSAKEVGTVGKPGTLEVLSTFWGY